MTRALPRVMTPGMVAEVWHCSERHVRNLIASGGTASWPLYVFVKSIDEHGCLTVFKFETDTRGEVRVNLSDTQLSLGDDYQPISIAEFNAAWEALQASLKSPLVA